MYKTYLPMYMYVRKLTQFTSEAAEIYSQCMVTSYMYMYVHDNYVHVHFTKPLKSKDCESCSRLLTQKIINGRQAYSFLNIFSTTTIILK